MSAPLVERRGGGVATLSRRRRQARLQAAAAGETPGGDGTERNQVWASSDREMVGLWRSGSMQWRLNGGARRRRQHKLGLSPPRAKLGHGGAGLCACVRRCRACARVWTKRPWRGMCVRTRRNVTRPRRGGKAGHGQARGSPVFWARGGDGETSHGSVGNRGGARRGQAARRRANGGEVDVVHGRGTQKG